MLQLSAGWQTGVLCSCYYKLSRASDLNILEHPLWYSLLALGANQWLLSSDILTQWERINERDNQLIVDALDAA